MQSVDHSGVFGEVEPFDSGRMESMLKNPKTSRVEVFKGTEENIKKRKKMVGKKYKVTPAYQKAPKIKNKK